jgi:hypothetical protein
VAKTKYFVTGKQHRSAKAMMGEILSRYEGPNGCSLDPAKVQKMLQLILDNKMPVQTKALSQKVPQLREGMFASMKLQVENVRRWNKAYNWGFTDDELCAADTSMIQFSEETMGKSWGKCLLTKTLVPYLDTPFRTFQALTKVMEDEHWTHSEGFDFYKLSEERFRISGVQHQPGLRWEMIDLPGGENWEGGGDNQYQPFSLPPVDQRPNAGILAEAAHSPFWARQLSSFFGVPGVVLTGYEIQVALNEKSWGNPFLTSPDNKGWWRKERFTPHRQGWYMGLTTEAENGNSPLASPILLAQRRAEP